MSYRVFTLKAGQPVQIPVQGKVILVDDTGEAEGVDITPMKGGATFTKMPKRQKAFKCFADYDAIILEAAVDCVVSMFLSQTDVSLGFASGALVNVMGQVSIGNDPDNRVPVDIGGGLIEVTASNVGINNTDETAVPMRQRPADVFAVQVKNSDASAMPVVQKGGAEFVTRGYLAAIVTDVAPVNMTEIRGPVLAVGAARRGFRIKNVGAGAVAIGGAGVTIDNAVVLIQPGETWNENEAPGAAWHGVCAAGTSSTLNIQVIA
ncbi:hypothetical protein [Massilia sp. GCM10023247]|uniref:hypothetical protein n=1 Tax=Massilia sp. GCM10023247 TaxID=3252643 RepID=UPI0036187367